MKSLLYGLVCCLAFQDPSSHHTDALIIPCFGPHHATKLKDPVYKLPLEKEILNFVDKQDAEKLFFPEYFMANTSNSITTRDLALGAASLAHYFGKSIAEQKAICTYELSTLPFQGSLEYLSLFPENHNIFQFLFHKNLKAKNAEFLVQEDWINSFFYLNNFNPLILNDFNLISFNRYLQIALKTKLKNQQEVQKFISSIIISKNGTFCFNRVKTANEYSELCLNIKIGLIYNHENVVVKYVFAKCLNDALMKQHLQLDDFIHLNDQEILEKLKKADSFFTGNFLDICQNITENIVVLGQEQQGNRLTVSIPFHIMETEPYVYDGKGSYHSLHATNPAFKIIYNCLKNYKSVNVNFKNKARSLYFNFPFVQNS